MVSKSCFVPFCKSRRSTSNKVNSKSSKISLFSAPSKDEELLKKWERAIRRADRKLTPKDKVCEKHFLPEEVLWYYEILLPGGVIERIPREKPWLKRGTVPSVFPDYPAYLNKHVKKRKSPKDRGNCGKIDSIIAVPKPIAIKSVETLKLQPAPAVVPIKSIQSSSEFISCSVLINEPQIEPGVRLGKRKGPNNCENYVEVNSTEICKRITKNSEKISKLRPASPLPAIDPISFVQSSSDSISCSVLMNKHQFERDPLLNDDDFSIFNCDPPAGWIRCSVSDTSAAFIKWTADCKIEKHITVDENRRMKFFLNNKPIVVEQLEELICNSRDILLDAIRILSETETSLKRYESYDEEILFEDQVMDESCSRVPSFIAENGHVIVLNGVPPTVTQNAKCIEDFFKGYDATLIVRKDSKRKDRLYVVASSKAKEVFKRICEKIDSTQMNALVGDMLNVEFYSKTYTNIGVREILTSNVNDIFSNRSTLRKTVQHLLFLYDEESGSESSKERLEILQKFLSTSLQRIYSSNVTVELSIFGSRFTGLAVTNSNVDIFLEIGHLSKGRIEKRPLERRKLSSLLFMAKEQAQNVFVLPNSWFPTVQFSYKQLNCNLTYGSRLCVVHSLLVKTYLEMDNRVKHIICAVKLWMKKNDLAARNLFTSYAQIWMVFFFLMQPENAVLPTVLQMRNELPDHQRKIIIENWNCAFPEMENIIWKSNCDMSAEELIYKFFQFYGQQNLEYYVLCTLTGDKIEKKYFHQMYQKLPDVFDEYKQKLSKDNVLCTIIDGDFDCFCLQDPFVHSLNLIKTVSTEQFRGFIRLCQQTVEIMRPSMEMSYIVHIDKNST